MWRRDSFLRQQEEKTMCSICDSETNETNGIVHANITVARENEVDRTYVATHYTRNEDGSLSVWHGEQEIASFARGVWKSAERKPTAN